jgi:Transposase DDE domain
MHALQKQHIVDLFVWVDDALASLPQTKEKEVSKGGRPPALHDSELLTILIWDGLTEPHKTLKAVYSWIRRDYGDCFPRLPKYQNFVAHCHRFTPSHGLAAAVVAPLRRRATLCRQYHVGSVQKPPSHHKVARAVAAWGKNWQGWHYGFKLHASIDRLGNLTGICFTPASGYDAQSMEQLVKGATRLLVGDSHYGASPMRKRLWKKYGILVVAPPHYKQRKKLMSDLQFLLLNMRSKIEATFDYLKEHMHLVSSFPRSVNGYAVHYLRTLLGYQVGRVS